MTAPTVEALAGIEAIASLQKNIVSTYEVLLTSSSGPESHTMAANLGRFVKLYRQFHVATGDMSPDRAIDLTQTLERIAATLGEEAGTFAEGYREPGAKIAGEAGAISPLPFLSSLTVARFEEAPYAYEAAIFQKFPSRR